MSAFEGLFRFSRTQRRSSREEVEAAASVEVTRFRSPLKPVKAVDRDKRRDLGTRSLGVKFFKAPQTAVHYIIFGGSTAGEALAFMEDFETLAKESVPSEKTVSELFHKALNELCEFYYPGKIFQMAHKGQHELADNGSLKFQSPEHHRAAALAAQRSGEVLEFSYRNIKQKAFKEFHMKRVLVTKVNDTWFRGKDSRGSRNYSFERMFSAGIDRGEKGVPAPIPYVQILMYPGVGHEQVMNISFGKLGTNGKLEPYL